MAVSRELERHLLAFLNRHLSPQVDESLLLAVSGGVDSTALLLLLHATKDRHGHPIRVAHVNHGVRADADSEEARLKALCADLKIPFRAARLRFREEHPSEAVMRKARYAMLLKMARATGCTRILLGHQRDDQAETVLMNLLRGAGITGLAGMAERRGPFLRPLLDVPRSVLHRYLEEIGAAAKEDPGNLDLSRTRNKIRHRILPLIESEIRPGAAARIAGAAESLRHALDVLDAEASRSLERCRLPAAGGAIRLDAPLLRSYPQGLIERVLFRAVAAGRGGTSDIHAPLWRSMTRSLMRGGEARFVLPGGVTVDLRGKLLEIAPPSGKPAGSIDSIDLDWMGSYVWGARARIQTRVEPIPSPGSGRIRIRGLTRLQVFDADKVRPPFRFRGARSGDVIAMEDSAGSRKLSDLLSERMVPRSARTEQPVLEDADGILWAPGIRRASRALVTAGTERIWIVRWSGDLPADRAAHGGSSKK